MFVVFAIVATVAVPQAKAEITPVTVDDICPSASDPCVIDQVIRLEDFPGNLDFGTRAVRIVSGGQLRLGSNYVRVSCGRFEVETSSVAVHMVLPVEPGAAISGELEVYAYRRCSDDGSVRCIHDDDCVAGFCSVGDGSIAFDGVVNGRATVSGIITLVAAGAVDVAGKMMLSGLTTQPEGYTSGGELTIEAGGPVSLMGRFGATGTGDGGRLYVTSGSNVTIDAGINLDGGEFAGGILIEAGGDVALDGRVRASVQLDYGFASGDIVVVAGGDVALGADKLRVDAHGGLLDVEANGDVVVGRRATIDARGAVESAAGNIELVAGDSLDVAGRLVAAGGYGASSLALQADADLTLAASSRVTANSRNAGGTISAVGTTIVADGKITTTGGSDAAAGSVTLVGGDVSIGGVVTVVGGTGTVGVELSACSAELRPGARVSVSVPGEGLHTVTNEQLTIAAGAAVSAPVSGANRFDYRSDGPAPLVLGGVSPAPSIVPVALAPCP